MYLYFHITQEGRAVLKIQLYLVISVYIWLWGLTGSKGFIDTCSFSKMYSQTTVSLCKCEGA